MNIITDRLYSRDYGYMIERMPFVLYGDEVYVDKKEEAAILNDKQATGFINLD